MPQSRTWKDGEDEGTGSEFPSFVSDEEIGFEFTSSVMKKETRTTVRTVEGVIIDVEIIPDD